MREIPDAMDCIDKDIKELEEERSRIIERIGYFKRELKDNASKIDKTKKNKKDLRDLRSKGFPSGCKHLDCVGTSYIYFICMATGYAGEYCPICGTLIVKSEYRKQVKVKEFKPREPFLKDCKHDWMTFKDFPVPVLSTPGRWCKICGRLEDTNPY